MSLNISFLTAENDETSEFELKWEQYLQPLQDSYEYEDFESSPRSSTPLHVEFHDFLDFSQIDSAESNNALKVDLIN